MAEVEVVSFEDLDDIRKAIFDVEVPIEYPELLELSKKLAELTAQFEAMENEKREVVKTFSEQLKAIQVEQRGAASKLMTGKKVEKQPVDVGHDYRDLGDGRTLGTKWVRTRNGEVLGPFSITESDMAVVPKVAQATIAGVATCISCQDATTNVRTIAGEPVCVECFQKLTTQDRERE